MQLLNKLPGYNKTPAGFEWVLFKKLPWVLLLASAWPVLQIINISFANKVLSGTQQQQIYLYLGIIFTVWFFVGVMFIGCIVVMLMKGPAYVADAYDLPKENKQFEKYPNL